MSMITERPVRNSAGQSPVGAAEETPGRSRDLRVVLAAYVTLTKPRIVELLLVTTVPAMMLAHGGMPSLWLVAVVLVGGSLAAGAASVINCYVDRDIDEVMRRTKRRPLPAHTVTPRNALIFGLVLAAVSLAIMTAFTNLLAAGLTLAAILYYDVVYTLWLKRTTAANTFWGGACGAAPVLIGWAAVTGSLSPMAWALFAVVFFWQLPHFYPLAMKYKDDYARAGIPMLPVVASVRRVNAEIVLFSWLTVLTSLAVWALGLSPIYGVPTLVVGAVFLIEAHKLAGRASRGEAVKPMRLFHWSTTYLTIVFAAAALDALL
ncbi:protoheme IX farnesyltransferase [Micromonospora qiuiae]|uniref:Protoheme IX farnesyltransferase n=1 Tax=Micromonospora qiuiae TaxID=502268 RepID=A0ABQ4JCH4_9ACTN|nr:heme o synthase [Micromonospora qiuiae]GIJ27665.1 protoheme IX farnesyltransferase [Micromonospora qiuiae]